MALVKRCYQHLLPVLVSGVFATNGAVVAHRDMVLTIHPGAHNDTYCSVLVTKRLVAFYGAVLDKCVGVHRSLLCLASLYTNDIITYSYMFVKELGVVSMGLLKLCLLARSGLRRA